MALMAVKGLSMLKLVGDLKNYSEVKCYCPAL